MILRILRKIKNILLPPQTATQLIPSTDQKIAYYIANGRVAWSEGYAEYKVREISDAINSDTTLFDFKSQNLPQNYGYKIDERIVEYAWLFSQLSPNSTSLLDAGSTFNFEYIVNHYLISQKQLFIHTYYPEFPNFNEKKISYIYGDLRELPYKDEFFEEIVSQSTIEHIDMDNSIYGYDIAHIKEEKKSYEYLKAVQEMLRVLKSKGTLLITFPYGKFENHGFFQQFDKEMLDKILDEFENKGTYKLTFFRYLPEGWTFCSQEDCKDIESFNPHTGRGKKDDGAAHCRSICCIKFSKQ